VDVLGYSMGAAAALRLGVDHPDLVDRLVLLSIATKISGMHPGLLDGIALLQPEHLHGSPFHTDYLRLAPRPEDFPILVERVKDMDQNLPEVPDEAVAALASPTLVMIGDSDIIRPEHAVEVFRLLGGGVAGDNVGLPRCQLAVLPGTTHVTLVHRAEWVAGMAESFLTTEVPATA